MTAIDCTDLYVLANELQLDLEDQHYPETDTLMVSLAIARIIELAEGRSLMSKMTYCTGDGCPMASLCARQTRSPMAHPNTPRDTEVEFSGYDVFREPPWHSRGDGACDYFWPEVVKGVTEREIPDALIIHMGPGASEHPSGMDLIEETDGQISFVKSVADEDETVAMDLGVGEDTDADIMSGRNPSDQKTAAVSEAFGKALLWPDAEEQDEVFQKIVRTLEDIDRFRTHCGKQRETKTEEVWLVLEPIRIRLHKIVYQGADPDDNG